MNQADSDHACCVAFDPERLRALGSLLRHSSAEIESEVRGGSMGNILPEGTAIRIRFTPLESFAVGQVVTYVAKDRIVAHRLVLTAANRNDQYAITRGDATICCDAPVPTSCVLGIVTDCCIGGSWQPVGPPARLRGASYLLASAMSAMLALLVRLNPGIACKVATRIVEIHRLMAKLERWMMRFKPLWAGRQS